jgi:chromate transporter
LIIFTTFVGYLGGGVAGAVLVTLCTFVPAFLFTLVGHDFFQRVLERPGVHAVLDGVTLGVVGLIAATAVDVTRQAITGWVPAVIFGAAVGVLFAWKNRWTTLVVVASALGVGIAMSRFA